MILPVKTADGGYNIYLERGALNRAGEYFKLSRKVFIVTDDGVPSAYAETVASQCGSAVITVLKQGEPAKCFENYKYLLERLVKFGFTRGDCVVAVGGGVMGDLAGFAAASYMRGIDFYNIPTTVLSQVDSSIGGKVAVDFEGYKNLVGAFYQPKGVIIDPDTLKTLPARQISNGLAEAVKMALTSDAELFEIFENGDINGNIDTITERSLKIKRSVVEKDEKEAGLRKILNFGHTLAHAIESESGMCGLYHGECVALGMLPMCSEKVRKRLIPVLERLNLPTCVNINSEVALEAVGHDKKITGDKITVIYVPEVGCCEMRETELSEFAEMIGGVFK